jgi:hypothetical protein
MSIQKTKTQVTLNPKLDLIVRNVMEQYPIYDVNQSIEFLLARGVKDYLNEIGLTLEDMQEIEESRKQINSGNSIKAKNMTLAIEELKK